MNLTLFIPLIEISIIALIVHYLLSFFWNTRAMDLIFGFLAFLLLFFLASWFNLPVLEKMMLHVVQVAVIAFFVIFQPEIRLALSKLSFKSRRYREISDLDKLIETLATSAYKLSQKHVGALIVLENQDSLDEYSSKAVQLQASLSSELLESLFETTTPLHDGGVIIRGMTIISAATIFPLADDSSQIARSMGTRHRAGLGISQLSDAVVIIVSEESGQVSIAREGIMTRGIKPDRFRGIIRSIFNPAPPTKKSRLQEWIKT
ncbi:MAG: diadenylate cyclase CdaA [Chlamydiae bacterium]|nr:diadenylate cyclase CdaA [Chlamydiota bacterium]